MDIRASNLQTNLFENNSKDKFVIDIEVDASDNSKSLKKLIYSKNNLKHNVLWVRHGVYRLSNENNRIIEDFDIPTIFF